MVALGSAPLDPGPALGGYYDGGFDSAINAAKSNAANANLKSGQALKATTRAAATPLLQSAQGFVQAAVNALDSAQNQYNQTDWSNDTTGTDQGVAQGAIQSAQGAVNAAQNQLGAAANHAQALPASGGGSAPPAPTPGPTPPAPTPEAKKTSSTPWGLIIAGLLAGGVIIWAVSSEHKPEEEKRRVHGAMAA